jgi:hypothetical protein
VPLAVIAVDRISFPTSEEEMFEWGTATALVTKVTRKVATKKFIIVEY